MDAPCEGTATRPGEPAALAGWRHRVENGENFAEQFSRDAKAVLDYLIEARYTDPRRVGLLEISRGGFLALHFAAADCRVKSIALMAPVTDVRTLRGFDEMDDHVLARSMAAINRADDLLERPIWFIIGDWDARVGTDHTIAMARRLSELAVAAGKESRVYLHVVPADGHTNPDGSHELVAPWIAWSLN